MWVGIDDTDSSRGGCTTWVLTELLALARDHGVDLIGEPRLVRLNPNIPWKTRGNAALSARFGQGVGPRRRVGEIEGTPVWAYGGGRRPSGRIAEEFVTAAWDRVQSRSRLGDEGTDPALVASDSPLPTALYWNAVREVVPVEAVRRTLAAAGARFWNLGSERGLVGAAAAIAWPARTVTWEVIAYRRPDRLDQPRRIDAKSVREAARQYPALFLCHDPRTRRLMVTPHTACPILYGLRGTRRDAPLRARRRVRSEPVDRWVLFRTNQGTGDHLAPRTALELGPFLAGKVEGTVRSWPEVLPGGHVRLSLSDGKGAPINCLAFEPTKTLPKVARALAVGDRVRVWGSRGEDPTFRLEGIELLHLVPRYSAPRSPRCPVCLRTARSLGTARGFRCPGCHLRWPPEAALRSRVGAPLPLGTYHPTPSARRHLAPLGPEP